MAERFSLKDHLFNKDKVAYLAGLFADADRSFDADGFQAAVMSRMLDLELKDRIFWIAEVLGDHLPRDFMQAVAVIENALPPPLDPTLSDDDFGDFIFAPLGEYVAAHGIEDHRDRALDALERITQRFSMEWPIRPFLNRWPEETLGRMRAWAGHDNYHVRRLVSEGSRPKLPWGTAVKINYREGLALLDLLYADPTRFVTRSVANHLNDVTKKDPALVLDTLARWKVEGRQTPKELEWMTRHALRTLVKQGDPAAMEHLGYPANPPVEVETLTIAPGTVAIGGTAEITIVLRAGADTRVIVDYAMHFRKANGSTAPKVFKVADRALAAGETVTLAKRHRFKGDATTFKLYPGAQSVEVQVNGKRLARAAFELS